MKILSQTLKFFFTQLGIIILLQQCYACFKVGFFTSNLESKQLTKDEFGLLKNAFELVTNPNNPVILDDKKIKEVTSKNFDNSYDVLFLAGQETNPDYNNQEFINLLNTNLWGCSNLMEKTGATSHIITQGFVKTVTQICYKRNLFKITVNKDGNKDILKKLETKDTVGVCVQKLKNDQTHYCFIGGHFKTSLQETVEKMMNSFYVDMGKLIAEYNDKNKIKDNNNNYIAYMIGDFNTRNWNNLKDESNLKAVLTVNLNKSAGIAPKTPDEKDIETQINIGDQSAISYIESNVAIKYAAQELKFLGANNLRGLPFTYKYSDIKGTPSSNIQMTDFKFSSILDTKSATDSVKVNNYGWLDRLACTYNKKIIQNCRINGNNENIKYYAIPVLRKADHMPILGVFDVLEVFKRKFIY